MVHCFLLVWSGREHSEPLHSICLICAGLLGNLYQHLLASSSKGTVAGTPQSAGAAWHPKGNGRF